MLEIKTITDSTAYFFDKAVNEALAEGWEIIRRECFITGADRAMTLYAELEREVEKEEEEPSGEYARWEVSRKPQNPFRCTACGYTANEQWKRCPDCKRIMIGD